MKNSIIGILGIILVYGVINIVLVGAQDFWHSGDQSKLDALKQELQTKKSDIDTLEANINSEKSTMDEYQANGDVTDYNSLVDDYNSKLAEDQSDVNDYNSIVQQANDLSNKIGGTWYVVPIPGRHSE